MMITTATQFYLAVLVDFRVFKLVASIGETYDILAEYLFLWSRDNLEVWE